MPVTIDLARCDGNGECVKACAFAAIEVHDGKALVFDNCTDCGACVLACTPHAIWSELFSALANAALLSIDFSSSSGLAAIVDRTARAAEASAVWMTVDPADAGKAADAIADTAKDGGYSLVVLPHSGAGPATAARVAARLGAHLMTGCSTLSIEDGGTVRAERPRYGGITKNSARSTPGVTVATILPRNIAPVDATALNVEGLEKSAAGDAALPPPELARRIVGLDRQLTEETNRAARALAGALGARVIDAMSIAGKQLSPDLYVAIGVEGSTEHNAALRNSRIVVAIVENPSAPIAQIADYLLVGDISEHTRALLASL